MIPLEQSGPEEKKAWQIMLEHWDKQLPIHIESLIHSTGVIIADHEGPESVFVERENSIPTLKINRDEPFYRQRFALTHGWGHLIFHPGKTCACQFGHGDLAEQQANRFACCILMPREPFLSWAMSGKMSTYDLARAFNVSINAVVFRLRMMGIVT